MSSGQSSLKLAIALKTQGISSVRFSLSMRNHGTDKMTVASHTLLHIHLIYSLRKCTWNGERGQTNSFNVGGNSQGPQLRE